jgi:excisionase family DNA binding protein
MDKYGNLPKIDYGRRSVAEQLKLPEVARRLGVSEKTARRYIKSGTLPSIFIGGAYRVEEEDLEAFLQGAKVSPPGKASRRSSPEPTLFIGVEDEWRALAILADALTAAADTWIAAVADSDINIQKRFGLRDAAIELFDRINARALEEWEELTPESRREIGRAMKQLNEIPEEAYRAMPDETHREAIEERRKKIKEWTQRISA